MLVRTAKEALADGKCVVIGLQSTGEAMTSEAVAERGTDIGDFVSGPKEMLLKVLEDNYPLPSHPDKHVAGARAELKDLLGSRRAVDEALGLVMEHGNTRAARAGSRNVQYNPDIRFSSEEDSSDDEDEDEDEDSSDEDDSDDDEDVDEDELEVAIVEIGSSDDVIPLLHSSGPSLVPRKQTLCPLPFLSWPPSVPPFDLSASSWLSVDATERPRVARKEIAFHSEKAQLKGHGGRRERQGCSRSAGARREGARAGGSR